MKLLLYQRICDNTKQIATLLNNKYSSAVRNIRSVDRQKNETMHEIAKQSIVMFEQLMDSHKIKDEELHLLLNNLYRKLFLVAAVLVHNNDTVNLELLFKLGFRDLNLPNNHNDHYLLSLAHYAAANGYHKSLTIILKYQPMLANERNMNHGKRHYPLHLAATNGSLSCCRHLIQAGANVDQLDDSNQTALYKASEGGNHEVVWYLLSMGADPDHKCISRCNKLLSCIVAAARGMNRNHRLCVFYLLCYGAKLDKNINMSLFEKKLIIEMAMVIHIIFFVDDNIECTDDVYVQYLMLINNNANRLGSLAKHVDANKINILKIANTNITY